jgi:large subunit ribosomal protein L4
MTFLTLKKIDFSQNTISSCDFTISNQLDSEGESSVGYTIQWQLAKRRAGSAKTKTMAEISGTTAKPYKQKGTGRARQGSKRSVQFVGGRTCHGPMPRSFDFSMPKKIVKKALSEVIKSKIRENKIILFFSGKETLKTSAINNTLVENGINSALFICGKECQNIMKSAKNLKNIKALSSTAINVYDMVKFDQIIVDSEVFQSEFLRAI